MIEIRNLTKHYGEKVAVDDLTFTVQSGTITGFLGPNGAGKSTTMRMILGLDSPTSGSALVNGRAYHEFTEPLHEVGAMLEARVIHPGRSGYNHLLALARTQGISRQRVDEVIGLVGLDDVAHKRVGGFSLGMGQRLGIAAALLGEPETVILDEPANGLDPEGILWIRNLLKGLAREGHTVFLSSHLMSEMALTAENLVIVGRGRLISETTVEELVERTTLTESVRVETPQPGELAAALSAAGATLESSERGLLAVRGLSAGQIGDIAAAGAITLHELATNRASLEEAFMDLTRDAVEYHAEAGPVSADHDTLDLEPAS
jgi:ABC-2 type transport system ATP-binding protein